ncbi:tRNA pseudouridine(38-40) synthase TruA [Candidatus Comchoanobacter bicostacola]|uniref:tRNA pseudouridine synthase A n=1 Tax=Candidatus Comchoanobacter bicostacola TaxID=2919598 RepID=A0ABY5DLZ1_9GAMM|nr:tRNA pseudouridine(38-40) synthase TruA [Candidatus Comchoanobacter bicostacola]UTC24776.1 tRNA pseudouridine(38-40) synthase TruA [Candidatus Comchoanobacter bicostacola]
MGSEEKQLKRLVLGLAYNGARYHGFQAQTGYDTVEGCLRHAINQLNKQSTTLVCAGRTDAGVHALAQVVHFDEQVSRPLSTWYRALNVHLPSDIQVLWVKEATKDFHARFSAKSRSYIYYLNDQGPHLFSDQYAWRVEQVDIDAMQAAATVLIGEHDFSVFQSRFCQSSTPYRNMMELSVDRKGPLVMISLTANAFLHHMVRKIVATLVAVGQGRLSYSEFLELFVTKNRARLPGQAPSKGLFLSNVDYADDVTDAFLAEFLKKD